MNAQDVTFTCTAGEKFDKDEGIQNLFDGNTATKFTGNASDDCYALITASEPVFVWGYDMTTANDNEQYGRCPEKWTLYGTNDEAGATDPNANGWVAISDLGNNGFVQQKNFYTQRFFCDKGTAAAYKYFKLVLNEGGFVQASEFKLLYEKTRYIEYNWKEGSQASTASACDGLLNTKFEGNNLAGNWFTIQSADGKPYAIKEYSFSTHDDGTWKDRAPKHWVIEGSNDNSTWIHIDEVDNDPIENENHKTFAFTPKNTTDKFRYVRVTLKSMKNSTYHQVAEFHVLAATDFTSDEAYYTDLVKDAKKAAYEPSSLSADDPWYKEYMETCNGLDAILESGNYPALGASFDKMNTLVSMMNQFENGADYVAFDGSDCWGDAHYSQLFDGKDGINGEGTKWGGNFSGNVGDAAHVQYVIFRYKTALQPYFYKLVTGGDTKEFNGRNWKNWKVYGANFDNLADAVYGSPEWTMLDSREEISTEYLPMENNYPAAFNFTEGVDEPYYYYMVAVTASGGTQQQMNEMYLCTKDEFEAARTPLVAYFDDLDLTRPVEEDMEDKVNKFKELLDELKTTDDAVRMTKVYNELVAMRAELEGSMNYMDLVNSAEIVDGIFQLGTAEALVYFSKAVGSKSGLNAVLTTDIDMTGHKMTPIGSSDLPYIGTFNGQGHTVKSFVYEKETESNVGLFGYISGATIENILLSEARVNGNQNAAGLVGNAQNASKIQNCAVMDSYIEGSDHVAALVGNAVGGTVVSNNISNANIHSRKYQAGGMVGTVIAATIEKNLFMGSVSCNGGNASGLVALIDSEDELFIRNNMVAATSVEGATTASLVITGGRKATFSNNYILDTTEYSTGNKTLTNENDENGKQVSQKEATCKSFYEALSWDMTTDWKFLAAGQYPVLAWMEAETPVQTISVTEAGYATMVATMELDFDGSGVEAFTCQVDENREHVRLNPITLVPAGEAIVVKAVAGIYEIPADVEYANETEGNDLKAAETDIEADGTQYVLAKPDGAKIGFYPATSDYIAKGKGYIKVADASVKALFFGEEETGIKAVETVGDDAPVYNLAGQRLSKIQKGVNIIGDKKILK